MIKIFRMIFHMVGTIKYNQSMVQEGTVLRYGTLYQASIPYGVGSSNFDAQMCTIKI
jgi:hypothetical protein